MSRNYPNWLQGYLEYTTHSEAPESFHFWTGVATIAGAIRRRAYLDMGYFRWFPNFFICFVAPPGIVSKSTTADIGMSLLRRVPGIKFGPNALTWQALITALSESREDYPLPDGTYLPMCAVTIVASELGTLLQPGDQSIVDALTDLWDGRDDPFRKQTKGGGLEIVENPWVNLVGCTTPAWIAANFGSYFIGGGFASRTIFVYAENKRQLVAYPGLRLDGYKATRSKRLADDLEHIASLAGAFQLTSEAAEWGTEWYARHHSSDNVLRLDTRLGGWIARKQTHLHKTAMVVSLARGDSLTITAKDLAEADEAITRLEPDMLKVFGKMNTEAITEQMASVLNFVRERGSVTRQATYANFMYKMGLETFTQALNGLTAAGMVGLEQVGPAINLVYNAGEVQKYV